MKIAPVRTLSCCRACSVDILGEPFPETPRLHDRKEALTCLRRREIGRTSSLPARSGHFYNHAVE